MKNIIVIILIGKNQVYVHGGYLLFKDRETCDIHLGVRNETRGRHTIVTFTDGMLLLPEKELPVYPDCKVYIVDPDLDEQGRIEFLNFKINPSLESVFTENTNDKIFILANKALYDEALKEYSEQISSIEVITLAENVEGNEFFEVPPRLRWQPVITKDEVTDGDEIPDYRLRSWKNEPIDF